MAALQELIGDSRTDSLPAGFLKSIKIKYKQEASHVFPPGTPLLKAPARQGTADRADSAASFKSTPSFMSWKVPTRLVHGNQPPSQAGEQGLETVKKGADEERAKLSSRMSALSIKSAGSLQRMADQTGQLPRLGSAASSKHSAKLRLKPLSPAKMDAIKEEKETLPVLHNLLSGMSSQGKKVITKIMNEESRRPASRIIQNAISAKSMEAVDKWLATATDKEREIALKFFSTLAGTKALKLEEPLTKYHTHTEGGCRYCDGDRIQETLVTLARGDRSMSRGHLKCNPKREPDLSQHSFYQKAQQRLPTRVRQQFQTWHHLPIYRYANGVPNKSSMFIQPHKPVGHHFSIHPEWGLHSNVKPQVMY